MKRVCDQDSIEWIGVVARQFGCCFEQHRGDFKDPELGGQHRAQVARSPQPSRLALYRRLPDGDPAGTVSGDI